MVNVMKKVIAAIVAILPLILIGTSLSTNKNTDFRFLLDFFQGVDHQVPSPRFKSPKMTYPSGGINAFGGIKESPQN
jgi:hypothetical protein